MSRSRVMAIAIAAGAAGLAAFLANGFLGSAPEREVVEINKVDMVPVLVALNDITVGEVLSDANMGWQNWPSDQVKPFMYAKSSSPDVFSKLAGARARAKLYEGEPINKRRVVNVGDAGFMAAVLPKGMRAISIRVSAETGAGGFILPNDRVDVILTRKSSSGDESSEIVLSNVRVLAIDQTFKTNEKGEQVVVGKTATLELEPKQSEILALVESAGQLSLALRSLADRGDKKLGDDGPRVSERYAKGSRGEVRMMRYGTVQKIANSN